jgi:hypothetical protein
MTRTAIRRIENQSVRRESDQVHVQMWSPVWQALTDCLANCSVDSYVESLEAELSSLRASVGEKPEDAYRRGWMEGMMAEAHAESGVSPVVIPSSFIICGIDIVPPYVAPPSTEKES